MSNFDSAPMAIENHTSSELVGLKILELDSEARAVDSIPWNTTIQLPVRSKSGESIITVDGYPRSARARFILTFKNGHVVECDHLERPANESNLGKRELRLNRPCSSQGQYRVHRIADLNRVVLSIQYTASPQSWMSGISDDTLLKDFNIPGTHETCALYGGDLVVECQSKTLKEQLEAGIRVIDIRCRHIENVFTIHHGLVYQHINFGAGVRDVCVDFLNRNPTETIVMSIKKEYEETDCTRTFAQTFDWYLQGFENYWNLGTTIPTLGASRGKIVLIRRFSDTVYRGLAASPSLWTDDATFKINESKLYVQDNYKVPTVCNIKDKWNNIKSLLDLANGGTDKSWWYLNFTSGTSSGCYPYTCAEGSPGITGENDRLIDYLKNHPGLVGSILMDFFDYPNNELASLIYNSNF